jgi:hypothetical protein
MKNRNVIFRGLAAFVVTGALSISLASDAGARAALTGSAGMTLTLTSIESFGSLGLNVLVTSEADVTQSHATFTPVGSADAIPTFSSPSGYWGINDSLVQVATVGGLAGDVSGESSSDLETTGTITLQNFSDASTTFHFAWDLNLDALVTQDGISPGNDYALAAADFSISDDLGNQPIPSGRVSVNTFQTTLEQTDVRNGSFSYTLQGGQTRILTIQANAAGRALAIEVPEPAVGMLTSSGALLLLALAHRHRA